MIAIEAVEHFQQPVDRVEVAAIGLFRQFVDERFEPPDLDFGVVARRPDRHRLQFGAHVFLDAPARQTLRPGDLIDAFAGSDLVEHGRAARPRGDADAASPS